MKAATRNTGCKVASFVQSFDTVDLGLEFTAKKVIGMWGEHKALHSLFKEGLIKSRQCWDKH